MRDWIKFITICLLFCMSISFVSYDITAATILIACAAWSLIKMRSYHIAATVRHSGRYIEYTTAAMSIKDAVVFFENFIDGVHHVSMDAISELDITETGESDDPITKRF